MEIIVDRVTRTEKSTIGKLSIVGSPFHCLTLEDKDRELKKTDSLAHIQAVKQHGCTAIPAGRYLVIIDMSTRFKKLMPLLVDVPGFAGIRIHAGNTAADTEGCLLLGKTPVNNDFIGNSKQALAEFYPLLKSALDNNEKVFITIQ
ncbi:DUF5675 family protein [Mucilaginibacter sp. 5B2]|nr:DUF5675 family protein [Mucilaginibacter sp. 5B2]